MHAVVEDLVIVLRMKVDGEAATRKESLHDERGLARREPVVRWFVSTADFNRVLLEDVYQSSFARDLLEYFLYLIELLFWSRYAFIQQDKVTSIPRIRNFETDFACVDLEIDRLVHDIIIIIDHIALTCLLLKAIVENFASLEVKGVSFFLDEHSHIV